ncbi:MAG: hypothetical protein M3146_08910, partial [Thermoproteota archaeon]|nr:hypothetical protein [Thermoproteota archaeon]
MGLGMAYVIFFFIDSYQSSTSFVIDGRTSLRALAKFALEMTSDLFWRARTPASLQRATKSAPLKFFVDCAI